LLYTCWQLDTFFGNSLLKSWIGDGLIWQEFLRSLHPSPSQMQQYCVKLGQDRLLPQHLSSHYSL